MVIQYSLKTPKDVFLEILSFGCDIFNKYTDVKAEGSYDVNVPVGEYSDGAYTLKIDDDGCIETESLGVS